MKEFHYHDTRLYHYYEDYTRLVTFQYGKLGRVREELLAIPLHAPYTRTKEQRGTNLITPPPTTQDK